METDGATQSKSRAFRADLARNSRSMNKSKKSERGDRAALTFVVPVTTSAHLFVALLIVALAAHAPASDAPRGGQL
jgi:hypothetical protein